MLSLRRALASAVVVASAIASLAAIPGCAPTTSMTAPDLQHVGLNQVWEHRIILATGEKIADTWRVGDSIYIATSQARLIRLDAAAGTMAWETQLRGRSYKIFRPADVPNSSALLVVNLSQAYLLNKQTGEILKERPLDAAVSTDPIVTGDNTFCVGGLDYFSAIYLDTLKGKKWDTAAKNDAFIARPAVQGDTVLLASESGRLWRINLAGVSAGDWVWMDRKTNGRVVGGLAADARAVYIPCLDSNVYAFDMNTGALLWNTPLQGRLDKNLVTTRTDVLVPTGNALYSLSTAKGDIHWHADGVNSIGTIAGDHVWVTDGAGNLKSLSLDTGEILQTTSAGGGTIIRNAQDKLILLINKGGTIAAYNPQ